MAKNTAGVTLTAAQRKQLLTLMDSKGKAVVAESIGINVHTLRAAAGGLSIQRGTAALVGNWLEKSAAQPAPGRE